MAQKRLTVLAKAIGGTLVAVVVLLAWGIYDSPAFSIMLDSFPFCN